MSNIKNLCKHTDKHCTVYWELEIRCILHEEDLYFDVELILFQEKGIIKNWVGRGDYKDTKRNIDETLRAFGCWKN